MVNNLNLTSVNVSVEAQRCDDPYLSLSAKGTCITKAFTQCKLIEDTPLDELRNCKFTCYCGCKCTCVTVNMVNFDNGYELICEINAID